MKDNKTATGSHLENPNVSSLRDELFPDGVPGPEEFIRTIANYIIEQRSQQET